MKQKLQIALTLFIAFGAVVGALMMWTDPMGKTWGGEALLQILQVKMPWPDVFFKDFIPSGFVLLVVNGFTQFVAAYWLIRKHRLAPLAVRFCGITLIAWIALEWWVFGFNAISNTFFLLGFLELIATF